MAVLVIHYSLGIFVGMFKKDRNDKKEKRENSLPGENGRLLSENRQGREDR